MFKSVFYSLYLSSTSYEILKCTEHIGTSVIYIYIGISVKLKLSDVCCKIYRVVSPYEKYIAIKFKEELKNIFLFQRFLQDTFNTEIETFSTAKPTKLQLRSSCANI